MPIILERPPQPCSELRGWMSIVSNYQMLIADTQSPQQLSELLRRSNLRLYLIVEINNIAAPINIERPRNMPLLVFIASAYIQSILDAIALHSTHIATHIHDTQMRVVQMLYQPRCFNQVLG